MERPDGGAGGQEVRHGAHLAQGPTHRPSLWIMASSIPAPVFPDKRGAGVGGGLHHPLPGVRHGDPGGQEDRHHLPHRLPRSAHLS